MTVKSRVCLHADMPLGNTSEEGRKAGGALILKRRPLGRVSFECSILTPRKMGMPARWISVGTVAPAEGPAKP